MTIATTGSRIQYSGNDSTTVFPYNFKITDEDQLEVILTDANGTDTTQTITTHYSVSDVGEATGGNVTMVTPPATGETLTIRRVLDLLQSTDLQNQGPFAAQTHEDAFDEHVMMIQQLQEEIDRCVQLGVTSGDDPDDYLTNIEQAVDDAETAQAAAEAAQTAAEAAQTGAETAETNAETAETNAEAAQAAAEAAQAIAEAQEVGVHEASYHGSAVKSGNFEITDKDASVPCNTSGSGFTITLHASPVTGYKARIFDLWGDGASNNIRIDGNGKNIGGSSNDFLIDMAYGAVVLEYDGTGWSIMSLYPVTQ